MKKCIIVFVVLFSFILFYNLNGSKVDYKKPNFTERSKPSTTITIRGEKQKKLKKILEKFLKDEGEIEDVIIITESIDEVCENSSPMEQEKQMEEICQKPLGVDQEIVDSINEWCWLSLEKLIALKEIGRNHFDYESFKQEVMKDLGIYEKLYSQEPSVMKLFEKLKDYINQN